MSALSHCAAQSRTLVAGGIKRLYHEVADTCLMHLPREQVQENMFRGVSLLFESLSTLYDEQLVTFVTLTQQLVSLVATITAFSVLFFSIYIIIGLIKYVHAIKYKYVCCCLALSTPTETARMLYKHFKEAEQRLKTAEGGACAIENTHSLSTLRARLSTVLSL